MKTLLLLTESLEPGNFHTGIYKGLKTREDIHVIPLLIPRDVTFKFTIYDELILKMITKFKIDILFSIQAEAIGINTLKMINDKGIQTIIWQVDDPYILVHADNRKEQIEKLKLYQYIYTTNLESIDEQYKNLGLNAKFLPFGYDPYYHANLNMEKIYDISFVGSSFPLRTKQYIAPLMSNSSFKLNLFGSSDKLWNNLGRVSYEDMIKISNSSKINLNFSDQPANGVHCLKNRVTEIIGMKQFLLSEHFPEAWEMFEPDKDIILFHSLYELKNKINYYLKHDSEREKIIKAGYEKLKDNYTYKILINNVLKDIGL